MVSGMFLLPAPPRVLARPTAALVAVVLLLTGLAVGGSPAQAREQAADTSRGLRLR